MIKVGPGYLFHPIRTFSSQVSLCLPILTSSTKSLSKNLGPAPAAFSLKKVKIMQSSDVTELHYLAPPNPTSYPAHFGYTQNNIPTFDYSRLSNPLYHLQINPQSHEFNPQTTCFSSNSTSDEADDQQISLINERKQRRMISNRESARRSRMRKQKHLDELWSQVVWLRSENHQLLDKLNDFSERHDQVLQENAQLKEETSELRQMLTDMQLNSPYHNLSNLEDIPCDTNYLKSESPNHPISCSKDLFH